MITDKLMQGNWVLLDSMPIQAKDGEDCDTFRNSYAYSPIQLTPEILIKSGFVDDFHDKILGKFHFRYLFNTNTLVFKLNVDYYKQINPDYTPNATYENQMPIGLPCKFLHNMQNIIYVLTGEELLVSL